MQTIQELLLLLDEEVNKSSDSYRLGKAVQATIDVFDKQDLAGVTVYRPSAGRGFTVAFDFYPESGYMFYTGGLKLTQKKAALEKALSNNGLSTELKALTHKEGGRETYQFELPSITSLELQNFKQAVNSDLIRYYK